LERGKKKIVKKTDRGDNAGKVTGEKKGNVLTPSLAEIPTERKVGKGLDRKAGHQANDIPGTSFHSSGNAKEDVGKKTARTGKWGEKWLKGGKKTTVSPSYRGQGRKREETLWTKKPTVSFGPIEEEVVGKQLNYAKMTR